MLTFRKNLILSLFQWPLFLEFFSHLLCRLCVFKHEFKKMTFSFSFEEKIKSRMGRAAEKRTRGRGAETAGEERKRGDFYRGRIEPCVSSFSVHVCM